MGRATGTIELAACRRNLILGIVVAASLAGSAWAEDIAAGPGDQAVEKLRDFSLEDLGNLTVISVSKRAEPLSEAPASVFVITAEDIRRAGATSLPEALRLAPNLEVARLNAAQYAITARGGNSAESSNKLLVLINGRSVYEPIGSGILWQQVDVAMDTVERIEVVSGPGGTLWGANAVNGVINVITKSDIEGLNLDVGGGNLDRNTTVTYGGRLGGLLANGTVSAFDRGGFDRAPGILAKDGFRGLMGAFRLDGGDKGLTYSLSTNIYNNHQDEADGRLWGGSVIGHANRTLANGSTLDVQAYVARDDRSAVDTHERRDTYNIQAQDSMTLGAHDLVVGGEARVWREYFLSTNIFHFADPRATISVGAIFVQDVVALRPDLKLTAGLKLEDNSYSGLDWMPNLRLAWTPADNALVWAAASRAVRTPNRIERELTATGILLPSPRFQSESLWAYEAGYRVQPTSRISLSVTAFYDVYDDLRTDQFPATILPIVLRNGGAGQSYGLEAWGTFTLTDWWRLRAGANTLHRDYHTKAGFDDFTQLQSVGYDPKYQAQLRSDMQIGPALSLEAALRRVGTVSGVNGVTYAPAYTEADVTLALQVRPGLDLTLSGFNLLNDHHLELDDASTTPVRAIPRSIYLGLRWGF
ncbi:MAG TPA: TonB-dependent receptor [Phenylobacterium sp.]|jgi:iron complex outermembrane receptor protein|uniref:TonB-dependent receptor plug domain-containing protein n=1 Tax=Phenylobacterium sp. TaxID=1871053 RepID=UPI002CAC8712|nr:TonB-dependent receptor [Phenylobacterium sp.]HXA39002.1 TonB-dependent receptor [Phenylobacterium sp.]